MSLIENIHDIDVWVDSLESHIKDMRNYEDLPSRLTIVADILICAKALDKAITTDAMVKLMQRIKCV